MIEAENSIDLLIMMVGAVVVLAMLVKALFERLGVPSMVGYLLIGLALGALDRRFGFLTPAIVEGLAFMAQAGIVALLFRVGLESNPATLWRQLPRAGLGWIGSALPSGLLGYLTIRWLGYPLLPALFVGVALSATSVGVVVSVWSEARALDSDNGALLVDIAELDDLSGILLMAVLLSLAGALYNGDGASWTMIQGIGIELVAKLALLASLGFLFARYLEARLTGWFVRLEPEPAPMLLVAGCGFMVAAFAGWLGFSLAIGGFFAGLMFSRDPEWVTIDRAFTTLSDFFGPFFFVGIGLTIDFDFLGPAIGLGCLLLLVGAFGKIVGTSLAIATTTGWVGGLLIGVSMVPRAEIAMIIMQHGRNLGDWAVPDDLFGAIVFVALGSCLVTPLVMRQLLRKYSNDENR
ncbi:MAG: cation:proton antiporter [Pseudomonadota bacterium]